MYLFSKESDRWICGFGMTELRNKGRQYSPPTAMYRVRYGIVACLCEIVSVCCCHFSLLRSVSTIVGLRLQEEVDVDRAEARK